MSQFSGIFKPLQAWNRLRKRSPSTSARSSFQSPHVACAWQARTSFLVTRSYSSMPTKVVTSPCPDSTHFLLGHSGIRSGTALHIACTSGRVQKLSASEVAHPGTLKAGLATCGRASRLWDGRAFVVAAVASSCRLCSWWLLAVVALMIVEVHNGGGGSCSCFCP